MAQMVSMRELATRLGMDRSHTRRYVVRLGYSWRKMRDSSRQLVNALTVEEADAIAEFRHQEGFTVATEARELAETWGVFYVMRLIPDLAPQRIKLGFASSLGDRFAAHRTSAPTAEIVKSWPCRRIWECTARDAATIGDCVQIGPEVYDCQDVEAVVGRCDSFFALLPNGKEVP